MRVLDLFSGIGGFSLGLERAGMRTVAFCEIDPYCRAVLRRHWPGVPCYEDVRKLAGADVGAVDIICGGYPCQPFSLAGKRAGEADDRHLWPEYRRLIEELRPSWVLGENVVGHISMGLDAVLADLDSLGYSSRAFVIPASALGARHRRGRVWIVANTKYDGRDGTQERRSSGQGKDEGGVLESEGRNPPTASVADATSSRPPLIQGGGQEPERDRVGTPFRGSFQDGRYRGWEPEPGVGRVAHGVPRKVDRLRALGNAVVPQIPEIIGRAIMTAEAA